MKSDITQFVRKPHEKVYAVKIDYSDNYQGCFVCGKENQQGLHLDFFYDAKKEEAYTVWRPSPYMQGFEGIVHGGFVSMVLDEVMAKVCLFNGRPAVTVRFEVRFKHRVLVDEEVVVRGRCIETRGKRMELEARCTDRVGEEKALAKAIFLCV